jgi:DNA-directed RNA polymerase specialized sigma subunit
MSEVDLSRHVRLIPYVLKKFFRLNAFSPCWDEAVSQGHFAVLTAAKLFDPARGKFSTFAVAVIRRRVSRYFRGERRRKRVRTVGPGALPLIHAAAKWPGYWLEVEEAVRAYEAGPERDRDLVRRHLFDGVTLADIARQDGVTRSATQQRFKNCLARCRQRMGAES